MPAVWLIVTPRQQRRQHDNHFVLSYCEEQMNVREDQTDSHTTIKSSCCCLQDVTNQPHNVGSTAQIRWGQAQQVRKRKRASTPKAACTLPKSCITKGKYIECAPPKASTVNMPCSMYVLEDTWPCTCTPCQVTISRIRVTMPRKAMTSPSQHQVTGPQPSTIVKAPKCSGSNQSCWIAIPYHCKSTIAPAMK